MPAILFAPEALVANQWREIYLDGFYVSYYFTTHHVVHGFHLKHPGNALFACYTIYHYQAHLCYAFIPYDPDHLLSQGEGAPDMPFRARKYLM